MEKEKIIISSVGYEFVPDEDGGHFKTLHKEIDVTDTNDREDDICKVCKFPDYPSCMERCTNMKWKREDEAKANRT